MVTNSLTKDKQEKIEGGYGRHHNRLTVGVKGPIMAAAID